MVTRRLDDVDLDHAVEVFRRHGWGGTDGELGVRDEADRRALWLAALQHDRDVETARATLLLHDRDTPPLERVRTFVHRAARDALGTDDAGSLLVTAACQPGARDAATSELVDDHLAVLARELVSVLELAMEQGHLREDVDPGDLAETLVVLVQGLHVVGRMDGGERRLRAVLREVDRRLDAALTST